MSRLASAFYWTSVEEVAFLSVDGFGDFVSAMLAFGRGIRMEPFERVFYPPSTSSADHARAW